MPVHAVQSELISTKSNEPKLAEIRVSVFLKAAASLQTLRRIKKIAVTGCGAGFEIVQWLIRFQPPNHGEVETHLVFRPVNISQ